jgi:Ubiquitin carboxyl-terminal hydrolase
LYECEWFSLFHSSEHKRPFIQLNTAVSQTNFHRALTISSGQQIFRPFDKTAFKMMMKNGLLIRFDKGQIDWPDGSRKPQPLIEPSCFVDKKSIFIGTNGNIKTSWKNVQDFEFLPPVGGPEEGIKFCDTKNNRIIHLSEPFPGDPSWVHFKRFVERKKQKTKCASGGVTSIMPQQQRKQAKKRDRVTYGRRSGPVKQLNQWNFSDDEEGVEDTVPHEDESVEQSHHDDGFQHDKEEEDDDRKKEDESGLNSVGISEKTPKRTERKYRRLQRQSIENSLSKMEDSDDELFPDATTTTETLSTAQRVVTPTERTQTHEDPKPDPGEESETSPQKAAKIHNFFLPKKTKDTHASTGVGLKDHKKHVGGDNASKPSSMTPKSVTTKTTPRVTEQQPFFPSSPLPSPTLGTREQDSSGVMTPELTPVDRQPPPTSKKVKSHLKRKHDDDHLNTKLALCSETNRSSPVERKSDGFKRLRRPLTGPRNSISAVVQGRLFDENNPFRGLRNIGNTCYLNASLQMLFTLENFISSLRGRGGSLVRSIVSTAQEVSDTSKTGAASARDVKKEIDAVSERFKGFEQRDAHEFIGDLIDLAHEEMLSKTKGGREQPASGDANSVVESNLNDEMKVDAPQEDAKKDSDHPELEKGNVDEQLPTDEWFRCEIETRLECKACKYSR